MNVRFPETGLNFLLKSAKSLRSDTPEPHNLILKNSKQFMNSAGQSTQRVSTGKRAVKKHFIPVAFKKFLRCNVHEQ